MLPITGDRLAAARPDRAEPLVSAVAPVPRSASPARTGYVEIPGIIEIAEITEITELTDFPEIAGIPEITRTADPTGRPEITRLPDIEIARLPEITRRSDAVPLPLPLAEEPKGCLYALSQPPLMLFLLVIGSLLGLGAAYDLVFL